MPMVSAKTLQGKLKAARNQMNLVDEKLYALHTERDQLEVRINTLMELLRELEPDHPELPLQQPVPNLTDAALEYISRNPGAKAVDVVNALMWIPSDAKDPRKNLHQTLLNLRNRGRIEKAADGGLKIVVSGNGTAPNP